MDTIYIKTELHHFIESASNEMLQNFLRSLASRPGEDHEVRLDLNRIVESNFEIRMKLNELMVDYR